MKSLKIDYDELSDILTIDGRKYSGDFFRKGFEPTALGKCYKTVIEHDCITVFVQPHLEEVVA